MALTKKIVEGASAHHKQKWSKLSCQHAKGSLETWKKIVLERGDSTHLGGPTTTTTTTTTFDLLAVLQLLDHVWTVLSINKY